MSERRVVVTGLGALTPLGNDVASYWEGLKEGKSGCVPITKFDASKFKTQFACEVKDFKAENYFDRKEARKMDLFAQYAIVTADEAIEDAGLDVNKLDLNRCGVIWGSGIGGLKSFQDEVSNYATGDGTPKFNPFFIPKMIIDISAGHISMKYGFRGPNFSTVSACASATNALIDAYSYIKLGYADLFVSGGSEAAITEAGIGGFGALKALSQRNDKPETASRPFDQDRDGFVLGEGAGSLILEDYDHAKARGAHIYAEISGAGMSADAYHLTAPHPEGLGVINVMENALNSANLDADKIDYINVHGTSTPLGDVAELNAIKEVFGDNAFELNISATKSMTGHLLGAAGAVEALAAILAIKHQTVPPTINNYNLDEKIDTRMNLTLNEAVERPVNYALSNTFGFGGHNSTIIFKRFDQ